jgi:hypothetical protein
MTTAINPLTQLQIDAQKKGTLTQLKIDSGIAAAGFGVAVVAGAFFPPLGLVGMIGAVIGISNTIDAAREASHLSSLKRSERELAEGKVDDTKKRADKLGKLAKIGRRTGLGVAAVILGAAITTLVAPALLPVAATTALISAIVYPALGVILASRVLEGNARGAEAVVKAAENPAPATAPPAAAPEATPKPAKGFKLRTLLGVFGAKAAPANENTKPAEPDAKPAVPEAKAAAPAAPKP